MTAAEAIWVGAVAALKADRIPRKYEYETHLKSLNLSCALVFRCISNIGAELNALEAALTNFENGRYSAVIKNLETIFQEGISSLENCHKKESFWDELVGALEDVLAAIPEFAVIRTVWDTVEYVIDGVKITEDVEAMLTAYKRAEIGRNANQMVLVGQHIGNILNTVIQMQKKK